MKKSIMAAVFALFASFSLFAKDIPFEEQLNKAATEVCADIEGQVKSIAILDVHTEFWAVSDYIVDELAHIFTRRFGAGNVIAHDEFTRPLISEELDYQQSGAVSDETIQEIGRELGVDCVIIGDFTETAKYWNLFVKATQVETKKVLSSWKGKISKKDEVLKFQIEKSQKSPKPKIATKSAAKQTKKKSGFSASMIDETGNEISVLHPGNVIRFRVVSDKSAYLAILCIDAHGEEEWLPLENNYIRAGESRIFPDIAGTVLRVDEGIYGKEQVVVYAAGSERELPNQNSVMSIKSGTRKLSLSSGSSNAEKVTIDYKIERER